MSGGAVTVSSLCGCDCHLDGHHALPSIEPFDWEQCDCVLCGEDRCRVPVSPMSRLAVFVERGRVPRNLADIDASPNYCESCRDHNLLEIRRAAVRRARTNRQNEKVKSLTKAMIQRGASRSRSPMQNRQRGASRSRSPMQKRPQDSRQP
jgi:hypothetical protein